MHIQAWRRRLYIDFYELLQRKTVSQCRAVSTVSAINRGLRATREASPENEPRRGGRDRSKTPANLRQSEYSDLRHIPLWGGKHKRGDRRGPYVGLIRTHASRNPENEAKARRDDVFQDIRMVEKLLKDIQEAHAVGDTARLELRVPEAKQTIERVNHAIRSGGKPGQVMQDERREWVLTSRKRLFRREGIEQKAGVVQRAGILEDDDHVFSLVLPGQPVRTEKLLPSTDGQANRTEEPHPSTNYHAPRHKLRRLRSALHSLLYQGDQLKSPSTAEPINPEVNEMLVDLGMFSMPMDEWKHGAGRDIRSYLGERDGQGFSVGRFINEEGKRSIGIHNLGNRKPTHIFPESDDAQRVREDERREQEVIDAGQIAPVNSRPSITMEEDGRTLSRGELLIIIDRIQALIMIIRKHDSDKSSGTNVSSVASAAAVDEVRLLVHRLNVAEPVWSGTEPIEQLLRQRLKQGDYVTSRHVGRRMFGDRATILRDDNGKLALVLTEKQAALGHQQRPDSRREHVFQDSKGPSDPIAVTQKQPSSVLRSGDDQQRSDGKHKIVFPSTNHPSDPVTVTQKQPSSALRSGDDDQDIPLSIPYTTAASSFLYGTNVVLAALRAKRRKLYQLYVSQRAFTRETNTQNILKLAREAGVTVHQDTSVKLLDRMSDDRPHNGMVLEASRLPAPPVLSLGKPDESTSIIPLLIERQSAEDIAVNGAPIAIASVTSSLRHPFVIMLDGITDPGNLGNILRTAHFYGVDAVAVSTNTCADLSVATLAKASSGACEAVQLLALPKPSNFVFDSAKSGWRVFAAVAPNNPSQPVRDSSRALNSKGVSTLDPLARYPCLLMLGAEGEGLRQNLVSKADHLVSIDGGSRAGQAISDVGVDSLNVGVAAGVLMEAFLSKPVSVQTQTDATAKDRPVAIKEEDDLIGELGW